MFLTSYPAEERESVRNWAQTKKSRVIRAATCRGATLMNLDTWNEVRNHTNAVEQTHNKSYSFGRQRPLLEALLE